MSCGGCPYNSFRDLHEKPGGAIGCSSIRAIEAYDTGVLYIPTMGAGGSIYSGWAPFNGNQHIYQYLGDGSYFHSGRGAIQSCIQGEVNITFPVAFQRGGRAHWRPDTRGAAAGVGCRAGAFGAGGREGGGRQRGIRRATATWTGSGLRCSAWSATPKL